MSERRRPLLLQEYYFPELIRGRLKNKGATMADSKRQQIISAIKMRLQNITWS